MDEQVSRLNVGDSLLGRVKNGKAFVYFDHEQTIAVMTVHGWKAVSWREIEEDKVQKGVQAPEGMEGDIQWHAEYAAGMIG